MAIFGRLRCHFCGSRSPHVKGTTEFQCTVCEAINFYDLKGSVVDTPASIMAIQQQAQSGGSFRTFTRDIPDLDRQQEQTFCDTCQKNQAIYTETLSNYFPEENHPRYREFEEKLPEFKANLEQRYPQVCKNCARKVQSTIHKTDVYAMQRQASAVMYNTRRRRAEGLGIEGLRDDWIKWTLRKLLRGTGTVVYLSLLAQVAWHAYGLATATLSSHESDALEVNEFAFDPSLRECAKKLQSLHFDSSCYQRFSPLIPRALFTSLCLLWYNHGLRDWFHHTHRVEFVHGQGEHFRIQAVMLGVRTVAWYLLSNSTLSNGLSREKLLAVHGMMIVFMLFAQRLSERPIHHEICKIKGHIMPKPEDEDRFSATAGPAAESYMAQASSTHPLKLLPRDEKPFPIENLGPNRPNSRGYSQLGRRLPSPPYSPLISDDGDPMDITWEGSPMKQQMPGAPVDRAYYPKVHGPSLQQSTRSLYNHGTTQPSGWGALRTETYTIDDSIRAEEEHKRRKEEERSKLKYEPPVEQTPFRGRLPQAPMSMERRLRNPPTQVQFKKVPASKQQDFMRQMMDGIQLGKAFGKSKTEGNRAKLRETGSNCDSDEDDISPAKSRTRGSLDLRQGILKLPSDAGQATGLEDAFAGKSFSLEDEPDIRDVPAATRSGDFPWMTAIIYALVVAVVAVVWNVKPLRRAALMWLVDKLE